MALLLTLVLALAQDECVVCDRAHESHEFVVIYKGRELYLCSEECRDRFRKLEAEGRLDAITFRIEPRGGLFHEDARTGESMPGIFIFVGLYVLFGLLTGAAASFAALKKGLAATPAFFLGLFMSLIGLLIVWLMPGREPPAQVRAAKPCSSCGHPNHPSAAKCLGCGADLEPDAPSEVGR